MSKEIRRNELGFWAPHKVGLLSGENHKLNLYYYHDVNNMVAEEVAFRRETLGSGPLLIDSQDFGKINLLAKVERWEDIAKVMQKSVDCFVANGAEAIALSDLRLHRVLPMLNLSGLPLIHIGEAVAKRVESSGAKVVGLFAPLNIVQSDIITSYVEKAGIDVVSPYVGDQDFVDKKILGDDYKISFNTRRKLLYEAVKKLYEREHIRGAILGDAVLSELFASELRTHFCSGYDGIDYSGEVAPREFSTHSFFDVYKIHIKAIADYCLYGN